MSDEIVYLGQMDNFDWDEIPEGHEEVEVEYYLTGLTFDFDLKPEAGEILADISLQARYLAAYAFILRVAFGLETGCGIYRSNGRLLTHLDEVVQAALEDQLDGDWGLSPVSRVAELFWRGIAMQALVRYMERSGG